jgi:hypothetical protein
MKFCLAATGEHVAMHASEAERKVHAGRSFYKSTFPLCLAYAITAHKAQGLTRDAPTVLHVRSGFELGLVYVMLSRVTKREHLRIVGRLRPEDCRPMPRADQLLPTRSR